MPKQPTASALICVRDGEAYLAEAIEGALAPTASPAEVIVVEDGSEDRSGDRPLVRSAGAGRGRAKQVGSASSGEVIAFLDCDDPWEPAKLELQLDAFARDPELDFYFTYAVKFGSEGVAARPGPLPGSVASALCVRRKAIEHAGGFDVAGRVGWLLGGREHGMREAMLPQVLIRPRVHRNNMTLSRRDELFAECAHILKASLDRRRSPA